jgi:hypothetical protein
MYASLKKLKYLLGAFLVFSKVSGCSELYSVGKAYLIKTQLEIKLCCCMIVEH